MSYNVSKDDLIEEFDIFGVSLSDEDIIDKLQHLCMLYRRKADAIVEEWVAFSSTSHITLTLENLDQLEEQLASKMKVSKEEFKDTKPMIYTAETIDEIMDTNAADDLFDAYVTPTESKKRVQRTPEAAVNKRFSSVNRTPVIMSPSIMSPSSSTPSQKYSARQNNGQVLIWHGSVRNSNWKGSDPTTISVSHYGDSYNHLNSDFKYMYQKFTDKAHVLDNIIEDIGQHLQETYSIECISHVAMPIQESTTVIGRICCDSNGRLNSSSVLLEGSVDSSSGRRVHLNLSELKEYSLFPGQIVAVDGSNTTGNKLVASQIYKGKSLPLPSDTSNSLLDHGSLHVAMAAGPFTPSDSDQYEPLDDLIKMIQQEMPDVCILFGPFMDADQELIVVSLPVVKIKYVLLENGYNNKSNKMRGKKLGKKGCTNTHLVFVSSYRDAFHHCVFPCPPYSKEHLKNYAKEQKEYERIHFVSDPSTLNISGIVFGLTTTDILFHLGAEEISLSPPGASDRLGRLVKHLLTQQTYYPLYPPPCGVPVDYEQFERYAKMSVTPDVLIVPSNLRYFLKEVDDCLCINPGRLTKGQVGGTYGRLVIYPVEDDNGQGKGVVSRSAAQILRI
ncbi:DNA polymerase alpha subunit B-like [Anneissia japonica]|uniref:DNA polymerase alpha subunit B-like n=1 Tax=Anneissia japonica TaxID=1529436 RepID=UPI0014259E78|nr:DNA polymerase alpha subunit B-like [Anneissia japonica]